MAFKEFSRKYIFFYFLLGHSPYPLNLPYKKPKSRLFDFALYLPSILHILCIIMIILHFFGFNRNQQMTFNFSLYSVFIINSFLNCIVAMKCSPLFPNSLKKIWKRFEHLEQYCSQCIQIKWSFKQCDSNLLTKYVIILILFSVRVSIKLILRGVNSFFTMFFHYSIIAVTFLALMHALLYLESLHFVMKTINKQLSKPLRSAINAGAAFKLQDNYEQAAIADIEVYKNIHYQIWQISILINDNFGWIFICYFMQSMNNILNLFTWIIIDIHEDDMIQEYQVLSMY